MNINSLPIRRILTFGGTVTALVLGFAVIQSAAAWVVDAAPLTTAPVSATSIENKLVDEQARSADLQNHLSGLTTNADQLSSALAAAQAQIVSDADNAAALQQDLRHAKARLAALMKSIRQAKGTTVVTKTVRTVAGATSTPLRHDGGDDDHERGHD